MWLWKVIITGCPSIHHKSLCFDHRRSGSETSLSDWSIYAVGGRISGLIAKVWICKYAIAIAAILTKMPLLYIGNKIQELFESVDSESSGADQQSKPVSFVLDISHYMY